MDETEIDSQKLRRLYYDPMKAHFARPRLKTTTAKQAGS
jgi:hypothetical protein